jgi:hypothetical protein
MRDRQKNQTPVPERRYNWLVRTLLRHYASNLRRSWRNTPHNAFIDALVQVEVPLALAVMAPLELLNLVLSRTNVPALARLAYGSISNGVIIVCALSLAIVWAVDRKLRLYEFIPGVETGYDSARDRTLVYVYFASGFIVLAAMLFAAYLVNRSFPATS